MNWKTLDNFDLAGKTVLVRVDINVPMVNGNVADATRIQKIAPTVCEIVDRGGKAVLLGHFGRPKGNVVPDLSLRHILPALERELGLAVAFADDCVGEAASAAVAKLANGEILLFENTRFHPEETANAPHFAERLAKNGDIYCNDAFSAAHRAHASTEGIAHLLPSCAGRLMQSELRALEDILGSPDRPLVAIIGGAKVSTKLELLNNLVEKVNVLMIGGGMANTFLSAQGHEVGRSLCEHNMTEKARSILDHALAVSCEIVLPADIVVAKNLAANVEHEIVPVSACPNDSMILDAGPASIASMASILSNSRTLVWNGPLGAFEIPPFNAATDAVARHAASLSRTGELISICGGGDTVSALNASGSAEAFTYVSTAGGAFLEWLEGRELPGVVALQN